MSFDKKNSPVSLKISYFALLREQRGLSTETITVDACTAKELYEYLKNKYPFSLQSKQLKVAINSKYQDMNVLLQEGDEVVFIPPVAGG